jgi:hypothetical protein
MRIEADNKRLERIDKKVETQMETAITIKKTATNKAIDNRNEVKEE